MSTKLYNPWLSQGGKEKMIFLFIGEIRWAVSYAFTSSTDNLINFCAINDYNSVVTAEYSKVHY